MKKIAILGSTGSIGQQTLEVVDELNCEFKVMALTANSSIEILAEQINKFKPKYAVLMNDSLVNELKYKLSYNKTQILTGLEGLIKVATLDEVELLVNAVVGAIGVKPTLAAIRAGKDIALANKETLVTAGAIVMREAKENDVRILPIDSEHNAIFQALQGEDRAGVKKIILTASGGPFRTISADKLSEVSVEEALNHPNWDMGGKITIDSATLMNKGLEVIEAKWLFDLDYEQIDVVVHPQSIIHSLVEYKDHSILAELGLPDMKVPIQYALTYPQRNTNNLESLNLAKVGELTFEEPRKELFPCLDYAYEAGKRGGTMPAVLNAANEVAVSKFLAGKIKFIDIPKLIKMVMSAHEVVDDPTLDQIIEADTWARVEAQKEGEKVC
ncbi:1-deoxy-D-xylulose 5-phosphate reductoisomerase [Orenia metallireducens]|uniref:1-deoxy-D-xylulose 5-phosphate reductoisomerase n=1 Tax=Orenia metallireducens TaxID=1413210 RepID=A0A285FQL9_9FIRM|nr:1-deoxy-D-xylulose-5-phosphate reductoisomerase [Orenia metallireducens]PRX33636.1 1-deoxy-D-xylulose 5-phosphate reductoisomerase [Orenia metallireducens]SNY12511.1 1-deoxy-D-xylulose 5-phosphate reductoisomerase [Orenia metallireducens]